MMQPARKTAEVIPLRPRRRESAPPLAAVPGAPLSAVDRRSLKLLWFLALSAALHGTVMLFSPAVRIEHLAETPDILTVRLTEVPQVAERIADPLPDIVREAPKPSVPRKPLQRRPPARAKSPTAVAALSPPAPVATEQPITSPPTDVHAEPADVPDPAPTQESTHVARSAPALVPPTFSAAYLKNPPPEYPALARRRGQEGLVLLRVRVSESGSPAEVRIAESSGSTLLDNAALEAVERWSFVPARRGDQPIPAWVEVPVRFRLKER